MDGQPGDDVRFVDVEEALRDRKRLQWLLPVIDGSEGPEVTARAAALAQGTGCGLTGIPLVDFAMGVSP